ncbi:MAG: hypothetical protein NTU73_13865, partial [Ignavibacteriae bacterium]|nr:hypothetical protein [Ignavibacteriota bacterium]
NNKKKKKKNAAIAAMKIGKKPKYEQPTPIIKSDSLAYPNVFITPLILLRKLPNVDTRLTS